MKSKTLWCEVAFTFYILILIYRTICVYKWKLYALLTMYIITRENTLVKNHYTQLYVYDITSLHDRNLYKIEYTSNLMQLVDIIIVPYILT